MKGRKHIPGRKKYSLWENLNGKPIYFEVKQAFERGGGRECLKQVVDTACNTSGGRQRGFALSLHIGATVFRLVRGGGMPGFRQAVYINRGADHGGLADKKINDRQCQGKAGDAAKT